MGLQTEAAGKMKVATRVLDLVANRPRVNGVGLSKTALHEKTFLN